jgi:hypothetical protein
MLAPSILVSIPGSQPHRVSTVWPIDANGYGQGLFSNMLRDSQNSENETDFVICLEIRHKIKHQQENK